MLDRTLTDQELLDDELPADRLLYGCYIPKASRRTGRGPVVRMPLLRARLAGILEGFPAEDLDHMTAGSRHRHDLRVLQLRRSASPATTCMARRRRKASAPGEAVRIDALRRFRHMPARHARTNAFMPPDCLSRRFALLLPLALAACGGGEETGVRAVALQLPAADPVECRHDPIEQRYVPSGVAPDVSDRTRCRRWTALRAMANDRLQAFGTANKAVFAILDAALTREGDVVRGPFAVSLTIFDDNAVQLGFAEARVESRHSGRIDDLRSVLYDMTKSMMTDMNIEFEYQIHRNLRSLADRCRRAGRAGAAGAAGRVRAASAARACAGGWYRGRHRLRWMDQVWPRRRPPDRLTSACRHHGPVNTPAYPPCSLQLPPDQAPGPPL